MLVVQEPLNLSRALAPLCHFLPPTRGVPVSQCEEQGLHPSQHKRGMAEQTPGRASTHRGQLHSVEAGVSVSSTGSTNQRCNPVSCGCLHCPGVCSHYRQERGCGGSRLFCLSMSKPGEREGDTGCVQVLCCGSLLAHKEPEPPACPPLPFSSTMAEGQLSLKRWVVKKTSPTQHCRAQDVSVRLSPPTGTKHIFIPLSSPPSAESSLRLFSRFV